MNFKVHGKLPFLAPQQDLLSDWKSKAIELETYIERYRAQIKDCWQQVKA